ncbi:MAG: hypothetical protein M0036_14120 [Desulfobacteraceae bacterium]|nr:hypothetical protein [Desulfobacteraceae bacterium]
MSSSQSYRSRLKIDPDVGTPDTFFSTMMTGLPVARGYLRIVIGARGPYIEFAKGQLVLENIKIPEDQSWRLLPHYAKRIFYIEFRSADKGNVKIYHQIRAVDYADYRPGLFYISPFDLLCNRQTIIKPQRAKAAIQLALF